MDRSTLTRLAATLMGTALAVPALADDPPTHPRARIVNLQLDGPTARPAATAAPPKIDPALRRAGAASDGDPPRAAEPIPVPAYVLQDPAPVTRPPVGQVPPAQADRNPTTPAAPQPGGPQTRELERKLQIDARGRLTLHMDDLDIRRALELLSRQGSLNIMISPGVTGRVTANLEGVTVEQALAAILKLSNLTARRDGPLIYVYSPEEFKLLAYHNQEIATRIYRLNYIRATDTMGMIQDLLSPDGTMTATPPSREGISESPTTGGSGGGGGGGATAPSSGGGGGGGGGPGTSGGNSMSGGDIVIVRDYQANLKAIDEIIAQIDVQPVQVLVEAVIISVQLSRNSSLGVNYAVVDNMATALGTIGNGADLAANSGFTPAKLLSVPADATAAALAAAGRVTGGTPAGGAFNAPTNGIKFGFVSKNNSGFIQALETLGEVRVLASPRILVLNKQRAEIQLGQRLGYATTTQNFTSTTQQISFLNTGTLLRIRPFVSSDGMVRMEIHPERSSGATPGGIPQTNTSELTTNVMIPDASTLVIGGLIENERDYDQEGLPGISRLPILGAVFGFKSRGLGRRELIVLLTPHIWKQDAVAACPPPGMPVEPTEMQAASAAGRKPADTGRVAAALTGGVAQAALRIDAQPRRHVVREGEDLWAISKLYYGSGRHYLALWEANRDRVGSPESIPVGTTLRVPPVGELDRKAADADPRAGLVAVADKPANAGARPRPAATFDPGVGRAGYESAQPRRPEPAPSPPARDEARDDDYPIHIVGRNETLRSIARDRLGDPKRAAEILALNRQLISAYDRLTPGLHLYLPRDAVKGRSAR